LDALYLPYKKPECEMYRFVEWIIQAFRGCSFPIGRNDRRASRFENEKKEVMFVVRKDDRKRGLMKHQKTNEGGGQTYESGF
jgi:hypothetical protein